MKYLLGLFILMISTLAQAGVDFVDSPSQCFFKKSYPCRIRVSESFLSFEKGSQKFHLGPKSSLLFNSESEIQILEGKLWVLESENLSVKSTSALRMNVSGEWFFEKLSDGSLVVRNLAGEIEFQSKYVFASESLPAGFQNWYGALDANGQVSRGVIRPIALGDFLKAWIPLSGYSMAELRKATSRYREHWGDTLSKSASLYQEVIERRMASHEEKSRRLAEKQKNLQNEQEKLRQMFREKNGLSSDAGH